MKLHPLINESSTHYQNEDKVAIQELEKKLTVIEMIGWCKGNIFKYEFRKELKGALEADEKKIETYRNYLKLFNYAILDVTRQITVEDFFKQSGIHFRYK